VCKRLGYANPLKQWQIIVGYNGTAPLMTAGGVQLVRTVDRADVLRSSSGARSGRAAVSALGVRGRAVVDHHDRKLHQRSISHTGLARVTTQVGELIPNIASLEQKIASPEQRLETALVD
jgi:hypothetical protein